MPASLHEIVAHKLAEVAARKAQRPLSDLRAEAVPLRGAPFETALQQPRPAPRLILEVKPASPSAGVLTAKLDLQALLAHYNAYAVALSVLTDTRYFHGSLALMRDVVAQSPHPVLCKDFILDPYQIYEARVFGASAVLLIVKILDDERLRALFEKTLALGMTPVVEVHTADELTRALALSPPVVLVNHRNLETLTVDLEITQTLVPRIPPEVVVIAASGIETRQDIEALLPWASCFLVGSALMRLPLEDVSHKLQELCSS